MSKVLIYSDVGVDGGGLRQLHRSLQKEIDLDKVSIARIDSQTLLNPSWMQDAILLIIPGGRDVFYHAKLQGKGVENIRHFVEGGGNYLGICAGAYFGCRAIEFEKGGALEVCAERELQFFPGIAKGSAFGLNKYSYANARGVEAACLRTEVGECQIYFNGGCFFDAVEKYPHINPIARYRDLPDAPPAIIETTLGRGQNKGQVILSGVHLEYSPHLLNASDPFLIPLLPGLYLAEPKRRELFRTYLNRLGVPLLEQL